MPRKDGSVNLSVTVTAEELEKIRQYAEQRGFRFVSDYVRTLIEDDVKNNLREDFKFEVNRGGYRGETEGGGD